MSKVSSNRAGRMAALFSTWQVWNRLMIVVGTAATVAATVIAFYALINPADLNKRVSEIVSRLEAEPILDLQDRFTIIESWCSNDLECTIRVGKYDTNETGIFTFEACSTSGQSLAKPTSTGFGKAQSIFVHTFRRHNGDTDAHLRVETPNGSQTIVYSLAEDAISGMPVLRAKASPVVLTSTTSCH